MKRFAIILISIIFTINSFAEEISGSVSTKDGQFIAGVVISDGLNTTLTDSHGKFVLTIDDDSRFVFISTPSGYISETLSGDNLFYKEIREDIKDYNFTVKKNTVDDGNHNVIVIADPQVSDNEDLSMLKKHSTDIALQVSEMLEEYTFGLCLGDISGDNPNIYQTYNEMMKDSGISYRHVIGNHDMNYKGRSFETSMVTFEDTYGPCWYSWNVGEVHYIVMNNSFYLGRDFYYIGYINERQLQWLERDLSYIPKGSRVIVAMHIPTTRDIQDRTAFKYGEISTTVTNKHALYEMLKPYNALILSGHMHTSDYEQINNNLAEINIAGLCGAWWCGDICTDGAPSGYKILEFEGDDMTWIYKGTGNPLEYQMKAYVDSKSFPGEIIVNVWDYDPLWKVEYFENGQKVCNMEKFAGVDPYAAEIFKDPSSLKRPWAKASLTDKLFRAHISEQAKIIEVRVTDRFGRVYSKKQEL